MEKAQQSRRVAREAAQGQFIKALAIRQWVLAALPDTRCRSQTTTDNDPSHARLHSDWTAFANKFSEGVTRSVPPSRRMLGMLDDPFCANCV